MATEEKQDPGVKTSEWWTSLIVMVTAMLPAVVAVVSGYAWAGAAFGVIAVVAPTVYIIGRAWLKAERAKQIDFIPEVWEDRLDGLFVLVEQLAEQVKAKKAE